MKEAQDNSFYRVKGPLYCFKTGLRLLTKVLRILSKRAVPLIHCVSTFDVIVLHSPCKDFGDLKETYSLQLYFSYKVSGFPFKYCKLVS